MDRNGECLRVEGVSKSYRRRKVVDRVTLSVLRGQIVGLLGPNGAGKTTTFRMIVGLIRPEEGQVFLNEREISRLPMYRRARLGVGYLPQESSIFRGLTVEENVLAILETRRMRRKERRTRAQELLERLQIAHLADHRADSLSGGERRRLEISRALAADPSFMLLDEPFTGIDPKAVAEIQGIVRDLRDRLNLGFLITDHQVRETLEITDRSYIIGHGKVFRHGVAADLVNDPEVRRIYLGEQFYMREQVVVQPEPEIETGAGLGVDEEAAAEPEPQAQTPEMAEGAGEPKPEEPTPTPEERADSRKEGVSDAEATGNGDSESGPYAEGGDASASAPEGQVESKGEDSRDAESEASSAVADTRPGAAKKRKPVEPILWTDLEGAAQVEPEEESGREDEEPTEAEAVTGPAEAEESGSRGEAGPGAVRQTAATVTGSEESPAGPEDEEPTLRKPASDGEADTGEREVSDSEGEPTARKVPPEDGGSSTGDSEESSVESDAEAGTESPPKPESEPESRA